MKDKNNTRNTIWPEEFLAFVATMYEVILEQHEMNEDVARTKVVAFAEDIIKSAEANEIVKPEFSDLPKFSGKFTVRTTPEIHRRLAIRALVHGLSLNEMVNSDLTARKA